MSTIPERPDINPPPLNINAVRRARTIAAIPLTVPVKPEAVRSALVDLVEAYDNLAARFAWSTAQSTEREG
jgi:hypothetical protein